MKKICLYILIGAMIFGMCPPCVLGASGGMPENAVVLKDIFTDKFNECSWGGWTISGETVDDKVKVGEKAFKIYGKSDGSFGQGALSFSSSLAGSNKKVEAAIAEGCAYIGLWEFIQNGTNWFEVKPNNGAALKTTSRGAWSYVYEPLTAAGNNGQYLYLKNQSTKDYWVDQIQIFMIPPEDTSMNIESVVFYDKAHKETDEYNVYINSPIEIKFDHYVMPNTGSVKLLDKNEKEIEITATYDNRSIKIQPSKEFDYRSEYKIKISGVQNMFEETVSDTEKTFYTVSPEFRVEYVNISSKENLLSMNDTYDELTIDALIINDSGVNKKYRFIGFTDDENGEKVFFASDELTCYASGNKNTVVKHDNFGSVKYEKEDQIGYYFLDDKNIEVDEYESLSTSFLQDTDVSVKGKQLTVNIETDAKTERKFTVAMVLKEDGVYNWATPGFVFCGALDENGSFSRTFDFSDYILSGYYDVMIYADGISEPYTETGFYYTGKQKRNEIINIIKTGTEQDVNALLENPDNTEALKSLGVNFDNYQKLTERKSLVGELVANTEQKEKQTENVCVDVLNRCILLQLLNETTEKTEFLLNHLSDFAISERESEVLNTLNSENNIEKFKVFFDKRIYEKLDELHSKTADYAFLAGINSVKEGDYPLVLKYCNDYKTELSFDVEKYMNDNGVSSYNQILVLKNLIGRSFRQKPEVIDAIEEDVSKYKKNKQNSTSSGGGGGGGVISSVPVSSEIVQANVQSNRKSFNDVDDDFWAYSYILELADKNVIAGYEDNTFRPNNSITRAEFVKILVSALFPDYKNRKCMFDDVSNEHWAYEYIAFANDNGIVFGIDEKHFMPDKSITNEEMAVICARTLKSLGINADSKNIKAFNDFNDISEYARMSVIELRGLGIIAGNEDYCFLPKTNSTRAQIARIIYQVLTFGGAE